LLLLTAKKNITKWSCAEPMLVWDAGYDLAPTWSPEYFVSADLHQWPRTRPLRLRFDQFGHPHASAEDVKQVEVRDFSPIRQARSSPFCAVQVVIRSNEDDARATGAPGNLFSRPALIPAHGGHIELNLRVNERVSKEPDLESVGSWLRFARVRSALLSRHHGKPTYLSAVVLLPEGYGESPSRRYPTIYQVPGFGNTLSHLCSRAKSLRGAIPESNSRGVRFLRVLLDASSAQGHHLFADSANNGPVGEALMKELIPHLEEQFRAVRAGRARFLVGHSSGGWSALWLQVKYPTLFGGAWSVGPDPITYSHFLGMNIYQDRSAHHDEAGRRRALVRLSTTYAKSIEGYRWYEELRGPGGQLRSLEAAFSPADQAGQPVPLFNLTTGRFNPLAVASWRKYDIVNRLKTDWALIGHRLSGKLHVYAAASDAFNLKAPVVALRQALPSLAGHAATVMVQDKRNSGSTGSHFDLMHAAFMLQIRRMMTSAYLKKRGGANRGIAEQLVPKSGLLAWSTLKDVPKIPQDALRALELFLV